MNVRIVVCIVAAVGVVSSVVAQSESRETPAAEKGVPLEIQEGSTRAPAGLAKSADAQAVQEVARLTIEASLAFDRGENELGRTRASAAVEKLKVVEQGLSESGRGSLRSKLAEQRGRLQLEYLGDEIAAQEAFEDAVVADENPAAQRLLEELIERRSRRTGASGDTQRN